MAQPAARSAARDGSAARGRQSSQSGSPQPPRPTSKRPPRQQQGPGTHHGPGSRGARTPNGCLRAVSARRQHAQRHRSVGDHHDLHARRRKGARQGRHQGGKHARAPACRSTGACLRACTAPALHGRRDCIDSATTIVVGTAATPAVTCAAGRSPAPRLPLRPTQCPAGTHRTSVRARQARRSCSRHGGTAAGQMPPRSRIIHTASVRVCPGRTFAELSARPRSPGCAHADRPAGLSAERNGHRQFFRTSLRHTAAPAKQHPHLRRQTQHPSTSLLVVLASHRHHLRDERPVIRSLLEPEPSAARAAACASACRTKSARDCAAAARNCATAS